MRERLRLFSPWTIAGFGAAISLGLVLVYPHHTLEQRLAESERGERADRLMAEYLKVFLKADPGNTTLRLSLAGQLSRLGAWADAQSALAPLLASTNTAVQLGAQMQAMGIDEAEAMSLPKNDARRAILQQSVRSKMTALLQQPLAPSLLLALASKALAAGDSELAATLLRRFAASEEKLAPASCREAAVTLLANGDYRTSARLSFRALDDETSRPLRRSDFLTGLHTLQAGGLLPEALAAADKYLDSVGDDAGLLRYLTTLAQAANRPDLAERYVKRLLQAPRAQYQTPRAWLLALVKPAAPLRLLMANATAQAADTPGELRSFDADSYKLGYDVFIANRNLEAARKLAQAAVAQRPELADWRKRLAQVDEWSGHAADALPQWQAYVKLGGGDEGWEAILRLSEGLFDNEARQAALEHQLKRRPGEKKWLAQLLEIYELQGKPQLALKALAERLRAAGSGAPGSPQRRAELELYLEIAMRAQDDQRSLETLRTLQKEYGPDSVYAFKIASQLYELREVAKAYEALNVAVDVAPVDNSAYWHAYAQIAEQMQDDPGAIKANKKILAGNAQTEADLSNLFTLLLEKQPRAAARIAEFAYDKFGTFDFASGALAAHNAAGDSDAARRFMQRLTGTQRRQLEQDPAFLSIRSALAQGINDIAGATRDLRAALKLRPDDPDLRAGMVWLMIAARDTEGLKQALVIWADDAENDSLLWGPFAAANMSLNRQPAALHFFRKSGFLKDDYLWLMGYAECLDANSQPELAWRIRRKAWLDLRKPEVLARLPAERLREIRDRLAATATLFLAGDDAQRVVRLLLRADVSSAALPPVAAPQPRDGKSLLASITGLAEPSRQQGQVSVAAMFAAGDGRRPDDDLRASATVRELALGYAMNSGADELARAWLATRFANQLSRPLWGDLALRLATDDRQQLNAWLDNVADWLPMYDRIEAAERAGRAPLAQSLAFDQLALLPADEELHARLAKLGTAQGPGFTAEQVRIRETPLQIEQSHLEATERLSSGLRLSVGMTTRSQHSTDTRSLPQAPSHDDEANVTLRRETDLGFYSLTVSARHAAADLQSLRTDFNLAPTDRLTFSGYLGLNQRASESALMRIAAMRSGFEVNLNYSLSHAEYARIGLGWQRYQSQENGITLGNGSSWNAELGHHVRIEYPNLTLRSFVAGNQFSDSGQADPALQRFYPAGVDPAGFRVLPKGAVTYGVGASLGTVVEGIYTRGWRPFADMSLMYNRSTGRSHNFLTGVAGSLLGQDVLMLRFQQSSGTPEIPQGFQEMGIHYKWFY